MSKVSRRETKKYKKRKAIIDAAENLFFSKGYDNVSFDNIARKADLGRSTLYLYFENKEELFFSIVLRGTVVLYTMITEEVKKGNTSIEKLAAFRMAYYDFAKKCPDYLKAYNYFLSGRFDLANIKTNEYEIELIEHSKYYSEYKKLLEQGNNLSDFPIPEFSLNEYLRQILKLRRQMLKILCSAIKQGITEGKIRSDVDPIEATVLLTLIANSIDNMPFDLSNLLDDHGISSEKFLIDVGDFIGHMVANK
jgi:AcrR family transcriptional regulator